MTPLDPFAAIYADPLAAPRRFKASGGRVIGVVGSHVPRELVTAAGSLALRLCGDPGAEHPLADAYLGGSADEMTRSLCQRLLDGTYDLLDGLVIGQESEGVTRLFWALRELRRLGERAGPPLHFLDLSNLPYRTSGAYDRVRVGELRDVLSGWAGRPISGDDLVAAIAATNRNRELVARVGELRRADPPRLSGAQALAVLGAGMFVPVIEHNDLLQALLDRRDELPARARTRVFLTGSGHDRATVYEALESQGATVVGEDHDWGELFYETPVDPDAEPIGAIAERYQLGVPSAGRHSVAERAAHVARRADAAGADLVIAFAWPDDGAPLWDFPQQRRALGGRGIPARLLVGPPYGRQDDPALPGRLAAVLAGDDLLRAAP